MLSAAAGVHVNVCRSALSTVVPATGVAPCLTSTGVAGRAAALTASLIRTTTRAFTGTPAAPAVGLTVLTSGAVVSPPRPRRERRVAGAQRPTGEVGDARRLERIGRR